VSINCETDRSRARDALFKWYDARLNVCVRKVGLWVRDESLAFQSILEQVRVPTSQSGDLDVKIRQQLEPKEQK